MVPSEDYSHGPPLLRGLRIGERRKTETDMAEHPIRKSMNTTAQTDRSRKAQSRPDLAGRKTKLPPINFHLRYKNRMLPTPKLLAELAQALPELYQAVLVVGRWVWVQFDSVPAVGVRQQLAQLGFHWNRNRKAWQHPCGLLSLGSCGDPRLRYGCHAPAGIQRN